MASKHTRLVVGAIVIAGAASAVAGCNRAGLSLQGAHPKKDSFGIWSDTEATFTLRPDANGVCAITGKETEIEVAKGRSRR